MIARFFQQLLNSCGLVFRTFRAFLTRQVVGLRARIRRVTSLSRQGGVVTVSSSCEMRRLPLLGL